AARGSGAIEIAPLAHEAWIAGCPRCRGHLLEVCGRAGFDPAIRFETDNFVAVEQLVAQGIGVATLPGLAVASFPLLPGVVTRPLPASERRAIHAVSAGGAGRVPAVASVLGHLRAVVAELTGGDAHEN
ncbi:MAG: LysR family transcriptional regulator, partial [Microbacterium sp.]|nr:LysR family transcriptional regulator [Microbacterium sp.]